MSDVTSTLRQHNWRARLRVRLIILLGVVSLGAVVVQFALIDRSLVTGFEALEAQQLGANYRAVRLNLDRYLEPLESATRNLASQSVLDAAVMTAAVVESPVTDLALWIPPRGGAAVGRQRVLSEARTVPLTADLQSNLLGEIGQLETGTGWVPVPGGLLAVSVEPARAGGRLALGRAFSQAEIRALEQLSNTVIEVLPTGVSQWATKPGSVWSAELTGGTRLRVQDGAVSERHQLCRGLGIGAGMAEQRAALCVGLRDSIYRRSQLASSEIRLASLAALALLVGSAWFFIDRLLLRRLERVSSDLERSSAEDQRALMTTLEDEQTEGDEIGVLSGSMLDLLWRLRRSQSDLELQQRNFRVLSESAGVGILVHVEGMICYANPFASSLTGYTVDELGEMPIRKLLALTDHDKIDSDDALDRTVEVTGINKGEDTYWARMFQCDIIYENQPARLVTLADTTELVQATKMLGYQATHDELTGLANRRKLLEQLEIALRESQTGEGKHAFLYLDLDQFKPVNDTCGHHAGDRFLQRLALLLHERLGPDEMLARIGGDEMGIVSRNATELSVRMTAAQMHDAVAGFKFVWDDQPFSVGVSIGAVLLEEVVGDVDRAMTIADTACYVAKEQGFNRLHFHRPGDAEYTQRMNQQRWMQELKSALDGDRFTITKQGIHPLNAEDDDCQRNELLLRMLDESGKFVAPTDFITAAERYRMMPMIDTWVLQQVGEYMHEARANGSAEHLFVNVSGQSLGDLEFRSQWLDWAKANQAILPKLTFEVTESAVIANMQEASRMMETIRGMGGSFALDDFGTGLCSFSYLQNMEVEVIKLDGQFVRTITGNAKDRALVRTLTRLIHDLGRQCIAEHVENEETLEQLRKMGVDFVQGYYFDRPVPLRPRDVTDVESQSPNNLTVVN